MSGRTGETRGADLLAHLLSLPVGERSRVFATLNAPQLRELRRRWTMWAHNGQLTPEDQGWDVWLICAGRGFGKTRAGAEWVSEQARRGDATTRIALVGATKDDARRVMVEGPSGVMSVKRDDETPVWRASTGEVRWPNGASAQVYGAAAAESLRGPEHGFAWADELGKWRGHAAWDNLLMGLRIGERPQALVTTTPRATPLMRRVMKGAGTVVTGGPSGDNNHLPAAFLANMAARYGATRLGRQEIGGELLEDVEGSLWPRAVIERQRVAAAPPLVRIVIGVDPPASKDGDACGIVAAGVAGDGQAYVLEDASERGLSPDGWALRVAGCYERHAADLVVAEKNQGGDMVRTVLEGATVRLPIKLVHASRGKAVRAEPIAAEYERGRVWHAGAFPALEDELAGLQAGCGYDGPGRSPDRADACVWALSELLAKRGRAGVRALQ